METVLRVIDVAKSFGDVKAVDGVSFGTRKGTITGLLGRNGAGKTTTLRMINGVFLPDRGAIEVFGRDAAAARDRIGYLPEERGLYKKMTCDQVITYMAELKAYPKAKIAPKVGPWLERMELGQYRYRKVEELSKGMQQKLQFITTVLHEPDILILDELFSGLDPLNMELIKSVILDLKRHGTTILFSTHVMEQAEKLCDNICMISRGKKVLDGALGDIKSRFGKNAIQLEIDGDGSFVRGLPGVKEVTDFNRYLELSLADGADPDTILKGVLQRVRVRRFAIVEPSLYDIFIDTAKVDPSEVHGQPTAGGTHA